MHFFVVAASKSGAPVDEQIVRRFDRLDLPEIPFAPDQHLTWSNQNGSVRFAGWQAFTEIGKIGSHWHADSHSLTGFAGLPVWWDGAWPAGKTWGAHLASAVAGSTVLDVTDQLIGMFSLYCLEKAGPGYVGSDCLSGGLLYTAELDDTLIVSNRASLVARVLQPLDMPPKRDWRGPGWLLYDGQCNGPETGFRDVSVLHQGECLAIAPDGRARIDRRADNSWDFEPFTHQTLSLEKAIEAADSRLRGSLRGLAALPFGRRELRLSGGKDSRLLLALILSEGLQDRFTFLTYGHRESSDSQIARRIGEHVGVPIEFDDRTELLPDPLWEAQRIHTSLVGGTVSGWDEKSDTVSSNTLRISGGLSTNIRPDGAALRLYKTDLPFVDYLEDQRSRRPASLLRPDFDDYYAAEKREAFATQTALLPNPRDFATIVNIGLGWRRWTGPNVEVSPAPWSYPYFDSALFAIALSIPESDRISEQLPFEIMRRTQTGLELFPFAHAHWPESATAHGASRPAFESFDDLIDTPTSSHWRVTNFPLHQPRFAEYLSNRSHPIYEIAEFDRVQELLGLDEPGYRDVKSAYSVLTAALWLGQDEHIERIRRPDDPDLNPRQTAIVQTRTYTTDDTLAPLTTRTGTRLTSDARICALIPYFAAERYLGDALDSLVKQTRKLDAIIVVDDCSADPPVEIVERFPEVTLLRATESSGPYRLIQQVIELTDFDAFLFQDADDWSADNRLEVLLHRAVETGCELIGSQGYRIIETEGEVVTYTHSLDPAAAIVDDPSSKPVHHPTTLVTRDLILRAGGFGTGFRYSGDTEFLRRAAFAGTIDNVPDLLYFYRTRRDSLTGSDETGNHTPVRRQLWGFQHARADHNADRVKSGAAPILAPMSMTDPVDLEYLIGPPVAPFGITGSKPPTSSVRITATSPAPRAAQEDGPPRPVFIIGAPRSGASLLASCLLQHPAFDQLLEPGWLFDLSAAVQRIFIESETAPTPSTLSLLGTDLEGFLAHFGQAASDLILHGVRSDLIPELENTGSGSSQRYTQATRFLCSDQGAIPFAFSLHRLFPRAQFLHVVRDPDEVVASLTSDNRRWYRSHFVRISEDEAYEQWVERVEACIQIERAFGADQVMRVNRADLLAGGQQTLEPVLAFLGEAFDPAVLRPLR